MRRPAMRATPRMTGPTRDVVDAVYERAQHSCELCTAAVGPVRGTDHHVHHRRPRQMGGTQRPDTNTPANLLLLCPPCHGVIETRRSDAYDGGWLLHSGDDPTRIPVLIGADRWRYLTTDGRYSDVPPEEP